MKLAEVDSNTESNTESSDAQSSQNAVSSQSIESNQGIKSYTLEKVAVTAKGIEAAAKRCAC